ncbi:MAG: NHLP leader peptide family RiPP precursor [Thermoanaerobaculia bacterium]|nr:NHLP leader peptide family RiPP precursor [Thermoanaerobaculia bacterium]
MKMTRGEMQDLLEKFASTNPQYRAALLANPKAVVEKQFNMTVPDNVQIKAVEENASTIYVVVPHAVAAGAELADEDLEKVAGGATVKGDANCSDSDGAMNTVVEINAEFSLL